MTKHHSVEAPLYAPQAHEENVQDIRMDLVPLNSEPNRRSQKSRKQSTYRSESLLMDEGDKSISEIIHDPFADPKESFHNNVPLAEEDYNNTEEAVEFEPH